MLLAWKIGLMVTTLAVPIAVSAFAVEHSSEASGSRLQIPDLIELQPGAFHYRASGAFTRAGALAGAPMVTVTMPRPLAVMTHQVTAAEYRRCVDAHACAVVDRKRPAADRPIVNVSWHDAEAYASWLSRETGMHFRLPTDKEWAYAAADRFWDDALPDNAESGDPGQRELARYEREASRDYTAGSQPRPVGSFGANENGLLDIGGNVWEWTDTCFVRSKLDASGATVQATANCGVRVVEGRHRTYITDFIRDARAGGCSVGTPPTNLGFRLVRDDPDPWRPLRALWGEAQRVVGLGA